MNSKFLYQTLATGCVLLALAACGKEEIAPPIPNDFDGGSKTAIVSVFSCSFDVPQTSSVGTKVDISDGEGNQKIPAWEAGDKIKIFYLDPSTSQMSSTEGVANASGTETTFTASLPEGVNTYYAVYPATLESSVDNEGNFSVKMRGDDNDEAVFSQACICIARSGPEKKFNFKNLCSILKFTLKEKGSILQVCGIGATPIDGTIAASITSNGDVAYAQEPFTDTHYSRQFKKVTQDNTTCYVAILPGVKPEGIAINHLATYTQPAAFARVSIPFERSHIYDLGVVDSHIVKDYYFTVSGSGNKSGLSWDNAGDADTFKKLVESTDDSAEKKATRYLHIWKTKGIVCHFGAGTYVFGNAQNPRLTIDFNGADGTVYSEFSIQGGYPATGGDTPDAKNNKTVFSGAGQYGILNVFERARIHINGITFSNAFNANNCSNDNAGEDRGAALYLKDNYGSNASNQDKEKKAAPRVWLTDCVFEGNRTTDATVTGKYIGGSAINIANGAVYADHCIFRNNFDQGAAGCVRLSGNYDREWLVSYAFFNSCLFTGNTVGSYNQSYGSLIHQDRKGGLLGMYNCTLYNNNGSAQDDSRHGWNILDFERSAIIANTTIVDNVYATENATPGYVIRIDGRPNGMNHFIFANNLLMNYAAPANSNRGYTTILPSGESTSTSKVFMEGGSLFGFWGSGYANAAYVSVTAENEYGTGSSAKAYGYADVDGANWNEAEGLFTWNGTLKDKSVTCNFMSSARMIDNVLKSQNINQENSASHVVFSITENGGDTNYPGFYAWLNSLNAINVDAAGNQRPSEGWTPGSYQVQ